MKSMNEYHELKKLKKELKMLNKIDSKIKLSTDELEELVFKFEEVDRIVSGNKLYTGTNSKWYIKVNSIIELKNRYFSVLWKESLTEKQKNKFYNQPIEVIPKHYLKDTEDFDRRFSHITISNWIKK